MHTNWREFQGGEEGPSKFNLAQWLAWDGMPRDTGEVLRCARAKSRSKAPDRVVAKLNRIVAAGISPDLLSIELWRVHEGMLHMRHATDPERVLRRLFEEVCLMAGKFGVDVIDADAVKRARAERKANHEQWRRQTSHEPGPESMPQDYRAAKDGESS